MTDTTIAAFDDTIADGVRQDVQCQLEERLAHPKRRDGDCDPSASVPKRRVYDAFVLFPVVDITGLGRHVRLVPIADMPVERQRPAFDGSWKPGDFEE